MTPATPARATARRVFAELLPYVRQHRWRVLLVLALLAGAKLANLGVPIGFKAIVDALSPAQQALAVPVALLLGYGVLRLSAAIAGELRTILFARVHIGARRAAALQTFRHVHQLGPLAYRSPTSFSIPLAFGLAAAASTRCRLAACERSSSISKLPQLVLSDGTGLAASQRLLT